MTAGELFIEFKTYLEKHGIKDAGNDCAFLISHHLKLKPYEVFLNRNMEVNPKLKARIERSMRERGRCIPAEYILGYKYFYLDKFIINSKVLIPRADSEHIIYAAVEQNTDFKNIIDIGTGCGSLAVSLSRIYPSSNITALDLNISVAAENIRRLGIKNINVVKSDFLKNMDGIKGDRTFHYDLIVSNPPYLSAKDMKKYRKALRYEPYRAFYGGADGLKFYSSISSFAKSCLIKGGSIIIEIDYKWPEIFNIFLRDGFSVKEIRKDYSGLERVMVVKKEF